MPGELDDVREAIVGVTRRRTPLVIVDLTGVDYMDSSGVATLVEGLQFCRGELPAGPAAQIRPDIDALPTQVHQQEVIPAEIVVQGRKRLMGLGGAILKVERSRPDGVDEQGGGVALQVRQVTRPIEVAVGRRDDGKRTG